MENNEFFKNYKPFVSFRAGRYGKSTLFENEHILVGLNCLEPGQGMDKHAHDVQCRFYLVLEGNGQVWVGDEHIETEPWTVIWVPPGHTHRIVNRGNERMVLLVGIAPTQADWTDSMDNNQHFVACFAGLPNPPNSKEFQAF